MLNWLEPAYQRWLARRGELAGDACYVEVNAEDLAATADLARADSGGR